MASRREAAGVEMESQLEQEILFSLSDIDDNVEARAAAVANRDGEEKAPGGLLFLEGVSTADGNNSNYKYDRSTSDPPHEQGTKFPKRSQTAFALFLQDSELKQIEIGQDVSPSESLALWWQNLPEDHKQLYFEHSRNKAESDCIDESGSSSQNLTKGSTEESERFPSQPDELKRLAAIEPVAPSHQRRVTPLELSPSVAAPKFRHYPRCASRAVPTSHHGCQNFPFPLPMQHLQSRRQSGRPPTNTNDLHSIPQGLEVAVQRGPGVTKKYTIEYQTFRMKKGQYSQFHQAMTAQRSQNLPSVDPFVRPPGHASNIRYAKSGRARYPPQFEAYGERGRFFYNASCSTSHQQFAVPMQPPPMNEQCFPPAPHAFYPHHHCHHHQNYPYDYAIPPPHMAPSPSTTREGSPRMSQASPPKAHHTPAFRPFSHDAYPNTMSNFSLHSPPHYPHATARPSKNN